MTLDINSFANPNFKALIANHTEYQFLLAKYYKLTQKISNVPKWKWA